MSGADLLFSLREFQDRLDRVRALMRARGIELLVVDDVEAMAWISGYGVSDTLWRALAVPDRAEPFMLVRSLDLAPARERSWLADIVGFRDWDDPLEAFVAELRHRGLLHKRMGLDYGSHSMSAHRFFRLKALLGRGPDDFGPGIWQLRWTKSPAELGYLKRAASIADAAMLRAVAAAKVGGTQRDVVKAAATAYLELGADDALVGPLTLGKGWDSLHGHESGLPLARGDVVHIELVPRVRDYSARIMRPCVVGQPTREQLEIARVLVDVQDLQLASMRPGAVACDIDAIVRNGLRDSGLRPAYDNVTGYTLGAYPATTQRISDFSRAFTPAATWKLEAGMCLHMYTSAAGLAFSESVHVTATGIERLTKSDRRLFSTA